MPKPCIALKLELELPYRRHTEVYAGVQRYAREHGWETLVDEYADDTLGRSRGPRPPYDGIIARVTRKLARRAAHWRIPLVNVWYSCPVWLTVPAVFPDYATVGRLVAEHLLDRGLTRFAYLGDENDRGLRDAYRAFERVVQRADGTSVSAHIPLDSTASLANWRRTERTLVKWLKTLQPPVGVYVANEFRGWMVLQLCQKQGWRIPQDIALVTGINEVAYCEHVSPTLTSVELGTERIGYEAANLLGRLLSGEPPPTAPIRLPPVGLVVRESTDFMHSNDPLVAAALTYIAGHSHLPIGPDDVAEAVAVGRRTLERRFGQQLERPIAVEIRRARIERAKRELTQTERSLAEISNAVGFGPSAHMHQVFVRELGLTPTEYRRRGLDQNPGEGSRKKLENPTKP